MAVSDIDIANLALAKLGAQPIVSFQDVTTQGKLASRTFYLYRDKLQRMRWNFNRVYTSLAALSTGPLFEYTYAYPLPSDFLRLELVTPSTGLPLAGTLPGVVVSDLVNSRTQAYRLASLPGSGLCVFTNYASPIYVIYGNRVSDPNQYDSFFVEAFGCYLAWQWCPQLIDSATASQRLMQEYQQSLLEARNMKAMELPPEEIPDDSWMASRFAC